MADHKSEIDAAVLAVTSNRDHAFENAEIDGKTISLCSLCGLPSDRCLIAEGPGKGGFLPCRGFVGPAL